MSKELEAFKKIVREANECGMWHCATEIDILEQTLTPPTEEEVCEAISDYLDFDFFDTKCVFKDNGFHEESYGELLEVLVDYRNNIYFYVNLPPHIVEMIARFYKEMMK